MQHLMIDNETLGTSPNAPVVQIAAVNFDLLTGNVGKTFCAHIDWDSALRGRKPTGGTLQFWIGAEESARRSLLRKDVTRVSMHQALNQLTEFVASLCPGRESRNLKVWGNGPDFDISQLVTLYEQHNISEPWMFYNVQSCRTAEIFTYDYVNRRDVKREGTHHNGVDDCLYQIAYVSKMYRRVREALKLHKDFNLE